MNLPQREPPAMLENPFFHRGPIRDRRYFFGRMRETRRALRMLRNGQCVSIVGPRRIGKTSLLFHLCDPEVRKRQGLGGEYLFVYLNCEGLGDLNKPQLYRYLWQEARRALAERGEAGGWAGSISTFSELRDVMIALQEKGHRPTLLFDEFDTVARNPNLDRHVFSDLRSLIPTVAVYATASHDSLYHLTYADQSVLSSPFFNIFEEIRPGFLRRDEAGKMVRGLLRMAGEEDLFTKEDLAFALQAGGSHPFFLQLACSRLFEQKTERGELTAADYERVRQQFAEDAEAHFRYAWKNLDASEREAARLVGEGGVSQLDGERRRRLERKCILHNGVFFSPVFAEFVRGQVAQPGTGGADEVETREIPIFLSYAREDEEGVADLYQRLSDEGFKPWMDKRDILPGERWRTCVRRAIRASDFFLVCLSANSVNKRGFVQKEIRDALDICDEMLDSDIYLIPVRLEDCDVPERLRAFQWVDLFEEDGWAKLVRAIRVGMERRTEADAA